ncbi:MAG: transposase [Candidatus Sulfotelmatobacter sp.]
MHLGIVFFTLLYSPVAFGWSILLNWLGPKIVHAACWSHAERYFSEAVQLNPKDPVATPIVARIDELFAIDAEARHQRLSLEARHDAGYRSRCPVI